jgi:L-threonylcarbamoyladenylate synthase
VLLSRQSRPLPPFARHVALPEDDASLARTLYATLRQLDAEGVPLIAVELPEARGLGWAIADRVKRAAAPRAL